MFSCCRIAIQPRSRAPGDGLEPETKPSPSELPMLDVEMIRSKSELRILQPVVSLKDGSSGTLRCSSSRSLFEASAYRVASHAHSPNDGAGQPDTDDSGLPQRFVNAYMSAIRTSNARWAYAPELADMLAENVQLVGQDKMTTNGKQAVIRRLEKVMEMIIKVAGKDAAEPDWDLTGPTLTEKCSHEMRCNLRRGVLKMSFSLEFIIVARKIVGIRNTRL